MLVYDGAGLLLLIALWLFCLIDVITTDESICRNLPKMAWLFIVFILPDVGSVLWLVAGRPQRSASAPGPPYKGNRGWAQKPASHATNPDDDEEFLRAVRRRADEQRRIAREQRERTEHQGPDINPEAP
jgi:Phospholipase_D-nuclease N-terminal